MNGDRYFWPVLGSIAVLVLSPALELIFESELLYVLVLPALIVFLWIVRMLSRKEVGIGWGYGGVYAVAALQPVVIMALVTAAVLVSGAGGREGIVYGTAGRHLLLMFVNTFIGSMITEEGFFRGVLWGVLERSRRSPRVILVWTAAVFALWHLPVAIIEPDFSLPASIIPVYIANAFFLGLMWGLLRLVSGSIVVPALAHGVWNALAYVLYGYGSEAGILGVTDFHIYGPERGMLGLVLNAASFLLFWYWWKRRGRI